MTTLYAPGLSGDGTIARAKARAGHANRIGWCLYHQLVDVFKVPGVGDYDRDGDADCLDYWKAAVKRGKVVEQTDPKKIPAGALLIWSGHFGHAATYLGDGKIASTDAPRGRWGIVSIDYPHKTWGHTLLGYVEVDGNGFTLLRDTKPPAPAPRQLRYQVAAAAGVNIRSAPSTSAAKTGALKKGTKVTADKVVVAEGRHWVSRIQAGRRQYMAREYFTKLA